eukprot:gnl/Chilomastix_cuspidata/5542.p2 GENE.gnl/Chilomastix_cuspidata/5542~~gnl/Chilomastix_cuspidata/5542.p2  ORF type:complete len:286 (+),score=97.59 gnl/Chilomastix_cuspidata/5542:228-1085(+)
MKIRLDSFDAFAFDCDGVIWNSCEAVTGARELIEFLTAAGKLCFFVTNNSIRTRQNAQKKLASFGIDVRVEQVVTSASAMASFVARCPEMCSRGVSAYVLGSAGLVEELGAHGLSVVTPSDRVGLGALKAMEPDASVRAVVVGMDFALSYSRLAQTLVHLRATPAPLFVVSNPDTSFPEGGKVLPECGAILAALAAAAPQKPLVIGKPNPYALAPVLAAAPAARTVMIGDRVETDIRCGAAAGCATCLVLSGVTKSAPPAGSPDCPTFVYPSVLEILRDLRDTRR